MDERLELDALDVFTTGTVGRPGERVFYLQARVESQALTFKCEKEQVAALAEYLGGLLADLPQPEPTLAPEALEPAEPISPPYGAGTI